jgi:hypothetical protein
MNDVNFIILIASWCIIIPCIAYPFIARKMKSKEEEETNEY